MPLSLNESLETQEIFESKSTRGADVLPACYFYADKMTAPLKIFYLKVFQSPSRGTPKNRANSAPWFSSSDKGNGCPTRVKGKSPLPFTRK
jgi:hypothetical protein